MDFSFKCSEIETICALLKFPVLFKPFALLDSGMYKPEVVLDSCLAACLTKTFLITTLFNNGTIVLLLEIIVFCGGSWMRSVRDCRCAWLRITTPYLNKFFFKCLFCRCCVSRQKPFRKSGYFQLVEVCGRRERKHTSHD